MPTGKPINEELKHKIINFYHIRPISKTEVALHFNLSLPTVLKILKNEPKYAKSNVYSPELKEDAFNEITDEMNAYFLGLIISDGNVFEASSGNRQKSVSITLHENDEYMLEIFKEWLHTTTKITHDGRGASTLAVRSNKIAENLAKHGVIPRKSFCTYLPEVDDNVMKHLIRGIFDGDGSIGFKYDGRRYDKYMSFCGTERLMTDIRDYICSHLDIHIKPKIYNYKNKKLSEFSISNVNDMKMFGKWIYGDATIYLKRKYKKYSEFLEHYETC